MNWAIEIQHTTLSQGNLADLLADLEFTLVAGVEFTAFTSPEIDRCNTPAEAFDIAKRLRTAFTGPAQIDPEFALGSVIDYSTTPPKRHAFIEAQSATIKASIGVATLTVSPPAGLSDEALAEWEKDRTEQEYQSRLEDQRAKLVPAYYSERAAKVLELLSKEKPSGETLYKIYELTEELPANRNAFHTQFGVSNDDFNRFKDAVHNASVSGDWARHATNEPPKTTNPMSRDEAESFVRNIASRWLQSVRANKSP
ncbi:MAG: hypothetical protein IPM16_00010 [Chloroflexi bacterium]|nr:hypothetical protein [Chloroflexota bacterium]